jgi:hypothetical protein
MNMADRRMDNDLMAGVLAELGRRVQWPVDIDLVLIGGAAGMLSGMLNPSRTTIDCDVIAYAPAGAAAEVERIARELAAERQLPKQWLNSAAQAWADALPDDWVSRRVFIIQHGCLRIYSIGRFDLLAMKLIAGRPQDVEDLQALRMTIEEAAALRHHLDHWRHDHWPAGAIREARELLLALEASA